MIFCLQKKNWKKLKVSVLFILFKKISFGMLNKKIEKMSVVFVFFEKNIFECQTKIDKKKCDDDVLSRIKMCCKKNIYYVENEKRGFLRKMLVGIKDDRDSVTRWENLQKDTRWENLQKDMDSD